MAKLGRPKSSGPTKHHSMTAPKLRIDLDYRQFVEGMSLFQEEELKKKISKSTLELARQIHKEAKSNIKSRWKKATSKKSGDAIISGLTVRRIHNKISEMDNARISTWGNRKKGSRSYYLSFFEVGTKDRIGTNGRSDKSYSKGRIQPVKGMNDAVNNNNITERLRQAIEKHIQEINHKIN